MDYLQLISVPSIALIVYAFMEILKALCNDNEKCKKMLPSFSAMLGGIFGIVSFYVAPEIIPASNFVVAFVSGCASGLMATGVHQMFKQLSQKITDKSTITPNSDKAKQSGELVEDNQDQSENKK